MSKAGSKVMLLRLVVVLPGLVLLLRSIALWTPVPLVSVAIFVITGTVVKLGDISSPRYGRVSFDAYVAIAAGLLFPLPVAVVISVSYGVAAALIRQEKVGLGGPLYIAAARALVLFGSGSVLGSSVAMASGGASPSLISWRMAVVLAFCATYFLLDNAVGRFDDWLKEAVAPIPAIADRFAALYQVYLATACVGILVAIMYKAMGPYALLVFSVPMAVIRFSFSLIVDIKQTYHHTIRALVRAIEVEDPHSSSHSERVAELAVKIAAEMGIVGDGLEAVNYGALLHDIGRIGLDYQALDRFMDAPDTSLETATHALVGAEILEQVPFLRGYSHIVAHHHDPYGGISRSGKEKAEVEARIVAVANCYDRLINSDDPTLRYSPNQAVAYMKSEVADFDPNVLRALASVLHRQGKLVMSAGYESWSRGAD